jgi:hypothetical protein
VLGWEALSGIYDVAMVGNAISAAVLLRFSGILGYNFGCNITMRGKLDSMVRSCPAICARYWFRDIGHCFYINAVGDGDGVIFWGHLDMASSVWKRFTQVL